MHVVEITNAMHKVKCFHFAICKLAEAFDFCVGTYSFFQVEYLHFKRGNSYSIIITILVLTAIHYCHVYQAFGVSEKSHLIFILQLGT